MREQDPEVTGYSLLERGGESSKQSNEEPRGSGEEEGPKSVEIKGSKPAAFISRAPRKREKARERQKWHAQRLRANINRKEKGFLEEHCVKAASRLY